jgi:hypothetical protein
MVGEKCGDGAKIFVAKGLPGACLATIPRQDQKFT